MVKHKAYLPSKSIILQNKLLQVIKILLQFGIINKKINNGFKGKFQKDIVIQLIV